MNITKMYFQTTQILLRTGYMAFATENRNLAPSAYDGWVSYGLLTNMTEI